MDHLGSRSKFDDYKPKKTKISVTKKKKQTNKTYKQTREEKVDF